MEPDIASLSVAVRWQDDTLEAARRTVADKATAARDHLLASGVAPADLQTSQLTVHTIRHRPERPGGRGPAASIDGPSSVEFVVATTLNAVFRRDITQAQVAVDGLFDVVGEGLELHGLNFDCGDRSGAQVEARGLAFADAEAKAAQLAELAGATLGPVRSIREGDGGGRSPRPMAMARMAPEASVPIEGGSLIEQVDLHIRWALQPGD